MNRRNPFDVLGLPTDPALTDEQIRAAWRAIAAATHPDRPDGGDLARYTQAGAAYAELRTPLGTQRSLGRHHRAPPRHHPPLPPAPPGWEDRPPPSIRPLLLLPERIRHGRPLRLALRAAAVLLSLAVLALIPGQPAGPAIVVGLITWFILTGRSDLAPPPRR